MRWWAAVAFLVPLLGGCSGKAGAPDAGAPADPLGIDVRSTATTGVIRGVVVDLAIRPIAGVLLTVQAGDRTLSTNSSATGAFGFAGLAPGTYLILAHKLGHGDVRAAAEVRAGEDAPPLTRIFLEATPGARPFVQAFVFKGFIECGTSAIQLCGTPDATMAIASALTCSEPVNQTAAPCVPDDGNLTSDHYFTWHSIVRTPAWVQMEMVWTPTSETSRKLLLEPSAAGKDHRDLGEPIATAIGVSPLLLPLDADAIAAVRLGNRTDLGLLVFSGGIEQDPGATTGVSIEQDFTVYTHAFYGYLPPEGYRFSRDGEPPQPA